MSTRSPKLPWVGTGWKMTKTRAEALAYSDKLANAAPGFVDSVNAFVLPAYPHLESVHRVMAPARIEVGAQNVHWADEGAFTGEVSAPMLSELGVSLCAIGHAERRAMFGETNETVRDRSAAALRNGITPLICVGESAEIRRAGGQADYVTDQIIVALEGLDNSDIKNVMLAYEPVWAIGEGSTPATADQAEAMHQTMRQALIESFGEAGELVPLLYGGSVNLDNARPLIECPTIDGLFVGRSAWVAEGFIELAHIVAEHSR